MAVVVENHTRSHENMALRSSSTSSSSSVASSPFVFHHRALHRLLQLGLNVAWACGDVSSNNTNTSSTSTSGKNSSGCWMSGVNGCSFCTHTSPASPLLAASSCSTAFNKQRQRNRRRGRGGASSRQRAGDGNLTSAHDATARSSSSWSCTITSSVVAEAASVYAQSLGLHHGQQAYVLVAALPSTHTHVERSASPFLAAHPVDVRLRSRRVMDDRPGSPSSSASPSSPTTVSVAAADGDDDDDDDGGVAASTSLRGARFPLACFVMPPLAAMEELDAATIRAIFSTHRLFPQSAAARYMASATTTRASSSSLSSSSGSSSLRMFYFQRRCCMKTVDPLHLLDAVRGRDAPCVCDVLLMYTNPPQQNTSSSSSSSSPSLSVWGRTRLRRGQRDPGNNNNKSVVAEELFFLAASMNDYARLAAAFSWMYGWQLCYASVGPPRTSRPWLRLINEGAVDAAEAEVSSCT